MIWIVLTVVAAVIVSVLFRNFCVFIYEALEDFFEAKKQNKKKRK